jgi:hypothetical protein
VLTGPTITTNQALIDDGYLLELTAGGERVFDNCPGYFGQARQLVIEYQPYRGIDEIRIVATSDDDTTLRVTVNDQRAYCDDDGFGDADPLVVIPVSDLRSGDELTVQVGSYEQAYTDAVLAVRAASADVSSSGGKKKEPVSSSSTASATDTQFVDLVEGFTPDPLVLSGISAGGPVTPGLDDCSFGFIPEIPQASIVYDSGSGDSNLVIYAESGADTTLIVVYEEQSYGCDDDSHGNGNPMVVMADAESGQYQVWVGTYDEGESANATLYVSEKRPR